MFYCGKITINKSLKISSNDLKVFSIQSIILDKSSNSNKKINVYININDNKEKFKICSLQKENNEIYNCSLILSTKKNQEYTFTIDGDDKQIINICGFVDYEENKNKEEEKEKIKKKEKKSEKKNNKNEENKIKEDNKKNNNNDKKKKKENKNEYGDLRDAPDIEEDSLDDNSELEIEKLLNKKRKEAPQDFKPIILKNLNDTQNNKNDNKNKEFKNKKDNFKNREMNKKLFKKNK